MVPAIPVRAHGWDDEILPIILGYADYAGDEFASPVSQVDNENSETRPGATLPEDLWLFYLRFGNASLMEILLPVADFYYLSAFWPESLLSIDGTDESDGCLNIKLSVPGMTGKELGNYG